MASPPRPARNAPCPCGSGRKYKNCCEAKENAPPSAPHGRKVLNVLLAVALVGVLAIWAAVALSGNETSGLPAPGPTPEPWEYDAANDRHWDPDHGHWHAGPPPPGRW